jgi:hypothetical protein
MAGYADRLKPRKNLGGQLGAPEYHESLESIKRDVEQLAQWVRCSRGAAGAGRIPNAQQAETII